MNDHDGALSQNERLLRAELTMLLGNATNRTLSLRQRGFRCKFSYLTELCDGDWRLARWVLLRGGWVPDAGGEWIFGKGTNPLEKAIDPRVLEESFVDILDDYRPIDDDQLRPIEQAA